MVREGAAVIDVGINYVQDPMTGKTKLVGDVDFEGKNPILLLSEGEQRFQPSCFQKETFLTMWTVLILITGPSVGQHSYNPSLFPPPFSSFS